MKFKPLGERALVRIVEREQTTESGIVLPDTAKEKPQTAEIVAVLAHLVQDRGDAPTGHAPRRPEIYYDRLLRPQDLVLERGVRDIGDRHKHLQRYDKPSLTSSV